MLRAGLRQSGYVSVQHAYHDLKVAAARLKSCPVTCLNYKYFASHSINHAFTRTDFPVRAAS